MKLRALNSDEFAPFGDVFVAPPAGHRTHVEKSMQNLRSAADFQCYINHRTPVELPHKIGVMERHPYSSQAFLPLNVSRYIVAVAPSNGGDQPDTSRSRCFVANNQQCVNYRAGVWHCPLLVLDRASQFVVLMWNDGSADDEEFVTLDEPMEFVD
jgi:ureidoglycolate lyase